MREEPVRRESPFEATLHLADGSIEGPLLMSLVGPNLYRLEESTLLSEVFYHDVVEAEPQPDGSLRFLRVVNTSGLTQTFWFVPKGFSEAFTVSEILANVMAVGGNWELTFGGFLAVHLPDSEDAKNVRSALDTAVKSFGGYSP